MHTKTIHGSWQKETAHGLRLGAQASAFGFKAWPTDLDVMDSAEGWVWGLGFEVCDGMWFM